LKEVRCLQGSRSIQPLFGCADKPCAKTSFWVADKAKVRLSGMQLKTQGKTIHHGKKYLAASILQGQRKALKTG
jgi:hypothetical protein